MSRIILIFVVLVFGVDGDADGTLFLAVLVFAIPDKAKARGSERHRQVPPRPPHFIFMRRAWARPHKKSATHLARLPAIHVEISARGLGQKQGGPSGPRNMPRRTAPAPPGRGEGSFGECSRRRRVARARRPGDHFMWPRRPVSECAVSYPVNARSESRFNLLGLDRGLLLRFAE